jgi:hypothetical protein
MHIDDLFVYLRLVYSRRFFDLYESQITSQIKLIRSGTGSGFDKKMWSEEARQGLRYAFFLRYYASFESHLKTICDRFAKTESLSLRLSDVAGTNFLERVNKYLTRVVECVALDKHPLWADVLSYSWIRNAIIHSDGEVRDGGNTPQYVDRQIRQPAAGLSVNGQGRIVLKRRFCYRAVRHMAQFLLDVYERKKRG